MCGIIGIIGKKCVKKDIICGLNNLMNRGYDSMGVYVNKKFIKHINSGGVLPIVKIENELNKMDSSNICLGHTRWATHGPVTIENSHPHTSNNKKIIIVHNGIINNYQELKQILINDGFIFYSDTDTEVLVNLIQHNFNGDITESIKKTIKQIDGTYAVCLHYTDSPNKLFCFNNSCPLLIGKTKECLMVVSETTGFRNNIRRYIQLQKNDICILDGDDMSINVNNSYKEMTISTDINYKKTNVHWTLSEINEQKYTLQRVTAYGKRIINNTNIKMDNLNDLMKTDFLRTCDTLLLIGCGSSYYAAKVGVYYFKKLTHFTHIIAIDGSEMSPDDVPNNSLSILLTQSGETRDLIACMDYLKNKNIYMIGCVNKVDSYISTQVNTCIFLDAGTERGVASTKSFTSQVFVLNMIALQISEVNIKNIKKKRYDNINNIINVSNNLTYVLNCTKIIDFAEKIKNKNSMFLLAKGINYPIVEEGALKIKELSYIHAEAYSGSALKHGPFSLLVQTFPVILIINNDEHYNKMKNAFDEIKARGANIFILTNCKDFPHKQKIVIDNTNTIFEIEYVILLQRLAYYLSIKREINPDYPRNLAKVVTVD